MPRKTAKGEVAANRRDAVLEASLRLFAERGLRATTMRDIAAAVGLIEGSLYHYFGSKAEIVDAIVERFGFHDAEVRHALMASSVPLPERLRALGRDFLAVLRKNPQVTAFLLSEGARIRPAGDEHRLNQLFGNLIRGRIEAMAQALDNEITVGRLRPVNTRLTAAHFFHSLSAFWVTEALFGGEMPGPEQAEAYLDDLVDLLAPRLAP